MSLRQLRRNDPHQFQICINLNHHHNDAAIAQALERNQYVSHIKLHPAKRNANWDNLCWVLATRDNLLHFYLVDQLLPLHRVPAGRIRPILQAVQQNASVRLVEFFRNTWEVEDLCSFLDNAAQITDLILHSCALREGEQGARDVVAALQRNTNIVTLKVCWMDGFLVSILEGLVLNSCVRSLIISSFLQDATRNALQGLLESSTGSLQHFELSGAQLTELSFRPIAQGLINGSIVTEITLTNCTFTGEGSVHLLNQILNRKQNLRSLAIKNCAFSRWLLQFLGMMFSALRSPASSLRHFQFIHHHSINLSNQSLSTLCEAVAVSKLDSFSVKIDHEQRLTALTDAIPSMKIRELNIQFSINLSNQSLSTLCEAVAVSKLDSFSVKIDHGQRLTALAAAIPSMKIRELTIQFSGYNDLDHRMKQTLREAFKYNYSLQSVKYRFGDDDNDLFDASSDETLKFNLERNIRLAQWVENPVTVPEHLWKEATTLAVKAGPEMLNRLLRKIGHKVLPVVILERKHSQ